MLAARARRKTKGKQGKKFQRKPLAHLIRNTASQPVSLVRSLLSSFLSFSPWISDWKAG